jgi:hypothetical protein
MRAAAGQPRNSAIPGSSKDLDLQGLSAAQCLEKAYAFVQEERHPSQNALRELMPPPRQKK